MELQHAAEVKVPGANRTNARKFLSWAVTTTVSLSAFIDFKPCRYAFAGTAADLPTPATNRKPKKSKMAQAAF